MFNTRKLYKTRHTYQCYLPSSDYPPSILSIMITKHISACTTRFNPFKAGARPCRVILAQFGPDAHKAVKFDTKILNAASTEKPRLAFKFTDGKSMEFDPVTVKVADIYTEVDRHSRMLSRKQELAG